jgi:hypothetical protein
MHLADILFSFFVIKICNVSLCPARVKRPGSKTDLPPQSSVKVKSEWIYISAQPYLSMAWCMERRRLQLYLHYMIQTDC